MVTLVFNRLQFQKLGWLVMDFGAVAWVERGDLLSRIIVGNALG